MLIKRSRQAERINTYIILVGKPEGKKPLGRPWHRRQYINTTLKEMSVRVWIEFMRKTKSAEQKIKSDFRTSNIWGIWRTTDIQSTKEEYRKHSSSSWRNVIASEKN